MQKFLVRALTEAVIAGLWAWVIYEKHLKKHLQTLVKG